MEIEIPTQLYELLLIEAAKTDSAVEEIAESAFRKLLKGMSTMPTNEKKGITVKIDAELHAEIRKHLEEHEMTMAEFITLAVQDELHPKLNLTEEKNMGNMRTLAVQVPEELFQKIKDYLQRNNISQKQFVVGLIEKEIERDLTQRAVQTETQNESEEEIEEAQAEQQKIAAVSDCESVSDEIDEQDEIEDISLSMNM